MKYMKATLQPAFSQTTIALRLPSARLQDTRKGPQPVKHLVDWSAASQTQRVMDPPSNKRHLSQLVESHTPEQLEALKAVLQQLGAQLDAAETAFSEQAGPEGKDVVDIREEWSPGLHGNASSAAIASSSTSSGRGAAAGAARRYREQDEASNNAEVASEDGASQDSFEALMQRMEALELDEEQWRQEAGEAAAAWRAAPRRTAAGPAAALPGMSQVQAAVLSSATSAAAGGRKTMAGRVGAFKPGFLLGKRLEGPAAAVTPAAHAPGRQHQAATQQDHQEQQRRKDAAAAAQRVAAFTGKVLERPAGAVAETALPSAVAAAAAGVAGVQSQPSGQQAVLQGEEPQNSKVSKFKLRRQLADS